MMILLSVQGRSRISEIMMQGDGNVAMVGFAMAFSSTSSSSLVAGSIGRTIRDEKHAIYMKSQRGWFHRVKTYHHASDSNTNGDIAEYASAADSQNIPVGSNDSNAPSTIGTKRKEDAAAEEFDAVVNARYACTRFQRYQEASRDNNSAISINNTSTSSPTASISNPSVVEKSHQCIALSQRAPTGFNAQPYRVILVHSKEDKERLSQYCLGRNADRVRDSDCTAVFLADRECGRDGKRFADFLVENMDPPTSVDNGDSTAISSATPKTKTSRTRRALSKQALFKLRILILLFSSGYPLPRFLSVPLSFGVRIGVSIISFLARCLHSMKQSFQLLSKILPSNIQLLPTLSSAETWSQKNTMLVAMTYMLACTSRGLATCPMEGVDASGVRKVLGVPRGRYSIPLIVSAGVPYRRNGGVVEDEETDDVGLSHGSDDMSPRFPLDEVVYGNAFGKPFLAT